MAPPQTNIISTISFSQFYPEDTSQGKEILCNTICSVQLRLLYVINHRKIICSSEPPRSLISFVPIDLMARNVGGAEDVGAEAVWAREEARYKLSISNETILFTRWWQRVTRGQQEKVGSLIRSWVQHELF